MIKLLVIVILNLLVGAICNAQSVQKYEVEAGLGLTIPVGGYHGGETKVGPDLGIELRYNFPYSRWDCGVLLNVTTSVYHYDDWNSDWYWDQSNRSVNIMFVGDYNFNQGAKVNPYVGAGVGIANFESINEVLYNNTGTSIAFRPMVGIELFHHLRLCFFSSLCRTGFNNIGISIGGVIGGRPKKID